MGLFDAFRTPDINSGVEKFRSTENAALIDVRTAEEYAQGHVPGSINIPLSEIESIGEYVSDLSAPLFVYCLSGARSGRAVSYLQSEGYSNVTNIGGIGSYGGEVER